MNQEVIDTIWHSDFRNDEYMILSDYYNGFRMYLKKYKKGYKFYVSIRRQKKHGIDNKLIHESPVAYFNHCSLNEAKIKGIEHFQWMIS
ncbi:hypothetical protein KHQ81_15635 (plasmid) [Mycoplasmatota bacterium]|nr:hypothetical protein KHQ81_15635 [Mycoplasmatota bacterium]